MLTTFLLAALLQALPPCELPDLEVSSESSVSSFQVHKLSEDKLGIAMSDPMAADDEHLPGMPDDEAPVRTHSADSRWVWSEASGWLLVPTALKVTTAAVGVDGSWIIEMQDPGHPEQRLRAQGMGACVGCAYSAGAVLFDSYAKQARENEFEFCRGLERPIVRDDSSDTRLRYHYDNAHGLRHDAVAVIGDDEVYYFSLVLSGFSGSLRNELLEAFQP